MSISRNRDAEEVDSSEEGEGGGGGENLEEETPEDNMKERRLLRTEFRHLIDDMKDTRGALQYTDPKNNKLMETLEHCNGLFEKVKSATEAALDSQAMSLIAQCGRQRAQRLHTDFLVFNPENFVLKARCAMTSMTLEEIEQDRTPHISLEEWAKFGKKRQAIFRTSVSFNYMFGAFPREAVKPRPRPIRQKEKESNAKTVPKELKNAKEASNEEATTSEVENIMSILWKEAADENGKYEAICYFSFVINPKSFSQSVENIFYTSFLVKDGHACIRLDDDKLPVIEPIEKKSKDKDNDDDDEAENSNQDKQQVVMPLTVSLWEKLCKTFQITDPIIPTRTYTDNVNPGLKRKSASK